MNPIAKPASVTIDAVDTVALDFEGRLRCRPLRPLLDIRRGRDAALYLDRGLSLEREQDYNGEDAPPGVGGRAPAAQSRPLVRRTGRTCADTGNSLNDSIPPLRWPPDVYVTTIVALREKS